MAASKGSAVWKSHRDEWMTMEESKVGWASLLEFAQGREKQNKAVKKENKSKRKGERVEWSVLLH